MQEGELKKQISLENPAMQMENQNINLKPLDKRVQNSLPVEF